MILENFQFESLADFMVMNGHGSYVWSAYGISAMVLLYLAIRPLRQRRALLSTLGKQRLQDQRRQQSQVQGEGRGKAQDKVQDKAKNQVQGEGKAQ